MSASVIPSLEFGFWSGGSSTPPDGGAGAESSTIMTLVMFLANAGLNDSPLSSTGMETVVGGGRLGPIMFCNVCCCCRGWGRSAAAGHQAGGAIVVGVAQVALEVERWMDLTVVSPVELEACWKAGQLSRTEIPRL